MCDCHLTLAISSNFSNPWNLAVRYIQVGVLPRRKKICLKILEVLACMGRFCRQISRRAKESEFVKIKYRQVNLFVGSVRLALFSVRC